MSANDLHRLMRTLLVWEAAAVLRHDLRNKLASVRNATYYIRRKIAVEGAAICERDARIPRFFELIGTELDAADTIISGRLPGLAGAPGAASAEVDLIAVAADAVAAVDVPHGVGVVHPAENAVVRGDRTELSVALLCLIENAVEAVADAGGGIVTIACDRGGRSVIEVLDDGIGMSDELAAHAAEQFVTTRPGRLGLGLSVARRLAHRAGGTLEIAPRVGAPGVRAALVLPGAPGR